MNTKNIIRSLLAAVVISLGLTACNPDANKQNETAPSSTPPAAEPSQTPSTPSSGGGSSQPGN